MGEDGARGRHGGHGQDDGQDSESHSSSPVLPRPALRQDSHEVGAVAIRSWAFARAWLTIGSTRGILEHGINITMFEMTDVKNWRETGVRVARAASLEAALRDPLGTGRATAVDFQGAEGSKPWIGLASHKPNAVTGAHHHGRHEVAIYVARGRGEIRWGERLEFATEIGPGDFVYFAPFVPHEERNLSEDEPLDFVVVRSDDERIVVKLDVVPVERPERMF